MILRDKHYLLEKFPVRALSLVLLDDLAGNVMGGIKTANDKVSIWVVSPALDKMFLDNLPRYLMRRIVRTRDGLFPR